MTHVDTEFWLDDDATAGDVVKQTDLNRLWAAYRRLEARIEDVETALRENENLGAAASPTGEELDDDAQKE